MQKFPKTEEGLLALADKLNITRDVCTNSTGLDRAEMQKRVLAMLSERRNSSLWIIALIAAIASAASAIAAWYSAAKCCPLP